MADVTIIGQGSRVRGRISGAVDLEVHGAVEGEVAVGGALLVEATALVAANLAASRIVVRGAVRGNLTADDMILLEDGARVLGDLRAKRVAIAPGALLRGFVQAGDIEPLAAPKAVAAQAAKPAPRPAAFAPAAKPAVAPVASTARAPFPPAPTARSFEPVKPALRPAPVRTPDPPPVVVRPRTPEPPPVVVRERAQEPVSAVAEEDDVDDGAVESGEEIAVQGDGSGPPPPVVPSIRKGAKGVITKKKGA